MPSPRTVRQMVASIQTELRSGDVVPSRARELLMTLTSLMGNCTAELAKTEGAYTRVLSGFLDSEQKANRAKIRAELSPEYASRQEARNALTMVVEMMRSLKVILRSIEQEMQLSR